MRWLCLALLAQSVLLAPLDSTNDTDIDDQLDNQMDSRIGRLLPDFKAENGVDYKGFDIGDGFCPTLNQVGACAQRCRDLGSQCTGFVFRVQGKFQVGCCWLKGNLNGATKSRASGLIFYRRRTSSAPTPSPPSPTSPPPISGPSSYIPTSGKASLTWWPEDLVSNPRSLACGRPNLNRPSAAINRAWFSRVNYDNSGFGNSWMGEACQDVCFEITATAFAHRYNINGVPERLPSSSIVIKIVDNCPDGGWCDANPKSNTPSSFTAQRNDREWNLHNGAGNPISNVPTMMHFDLVDVSLPAGHPWKTYGILGNPARNAHQMLVDYKRVAC